MGYDMCVDYDTLCDIGDELQKIEHNLEESTQKMTNAILRSQKFLSGNQFEKAKVTTERCLILTKRTRENIMLARTYIEQLRACVNEYGGCSYSGED